MNYPKFAVGEDVLILSEDHPVVNGAEAEIIKRVNSPEYGYIYVVSPDPAPPNEEWSEFWYESALRKRPSDFTFKELMDSLKTPVPA